jgi:hypothetical protein
VGKLAIRDTQRDRLVEVSREASAFRYLLVSLRVL